MLNFPPFLYPGICSTVTPFKVVFATHLTDEPSSEIHISNLDGSSLIRLTRTAAAEVRPAWSPDCNILAFASKEPDEAFKYELHIMSSDGSGRRRVIEAPYSDSRPVWSPDGARIAFERRIPHPYGVTHFASDICVASVDGTGLKCLTNAAASDDPKPHISPSWSPDGRYLAFTGWTASGDTSRTEIFLIDPDTSSITQLTHSASGVGAGAASWSPDGTKIAYECSSGSENIFSAIRHICVMNADGSTATMLTKGGTLDVRDKEPVERNPLWIPSPR